MADFVGSKEATNSVGVGNTKRIPVKSNGARYVGQELNNKDVKADGDLHIEGESNRVS
jgi:hypothetical protein